jgi:hypothetical protein
MSLTAIQVQSRIGLPIAIAIIINVLLTGDDPEMSAMIDFSIVHGSCYSLGRVWWLTGACDSGFEGGRCIPLEFLSVVRILC